MIIDTSAVIAILLGEEERERFLGLIHSCPLPKMGSVHYLEASLKVDYRQNPIASHELDSLLKALRIDIVAITPQQARIARHANSLYGKHSGHEAKLNFGDCLAYALSKDLDEPLLFKGRDFGYTDVRAALKMGDD